MNESLLAIVVIGRNEGQRLRRCLESITRIRDLAQGTEVIYVDSGSTDGSPALARSLGAEVIVLNVERPTAALGRNAGWRRAQAPYVLLLDGDTVLDPGFPAAALSAIAGDDTIAAVWGNLREIHPERSIYNRVLNLDWIYPPGDTEFCGGNALLCRSALEQMDGFDATLIAGEEPELCRRLRAAGHRILHIDSPMADHDLAMTKWGQYWRRSTRSGHAYAELSDRFRASEDPLWLAASRANLKRGAFWLFSLAAAIVALAWTPMPLLAGLALFFVLAARSGWNARWKVPQKTAGRTALLFAYGIHSHLQQIPICIGQLKYYRDRRAGKRRNLIEYRGGGNT